MATETGKCVLIIDDQRFQGITFGVEWNGGPQAFGFLSGPIETLMKARTARRVELELGDGTKLPARMLQASHSGMALVVIDPKLLPWNKARPDK
jgi:hypothetical protein